MENFLPFNITIIEAISVLLAVILCVVLIISGLRRKHTLARHLKDNKYDENTDRTNTAISVIVIADSRNGGDLTATVPLYLKQNHPNFEVIVVDTDTTGHVHDLLTILTAEYPQLRSTFIPDTVCNVSVQKLAIMLGIKAAKNEAILITQADCYPQSNEWLNAMARHFDEGKDIVIGYCGISNDSNRGGGHRYRNYDQTMEASQYLAAAIHGNTFRANGKNIAYHKKLFFDNKGFSKTLNLKYGDDDIFITEIATKSNIAIETSAESILEQKDKDYSQYYFYNRAHRYFTLRKMHSSALFIGSVLSLLYYIFLVLCLGIIGRGIYLFICSDDIIRPCILIQATLILYFAELFTNIYTFRRFAKILRSPYLFFSIPVFRFVRPVINKILSFRAGKADNYTWE